MDEHQVNIRPPLWLPIIVVLLAGGAYIYGKTIETRHVDTATITVQGEGKVYATPDIALLQFGVQTGRQPTAQKAMEILSTKMTAIIDAVRAAGVEEKDIQTQNLWLNPAYDYMDGKTVDRGFEANQNLQVKVRDQAKLTATLDAAVRGGANQVGGVSFTIDDPDQLQMQAREEAIADAKTKAKELATDLGVTLGKLKGFSEGGDGMPPVMPMARMETMAMGAVDMMAPPMPAGEQELQVFVSLTYEVR